MIRDFAIVDRLECALGPGMTVLTGETGAGKSILVDALALAVGERASPSVIRAGCERAEITAVFGVSNLPGVQQWFQEQALEAEEGECMLRRVLCGDGRSRGFINARPVPVQVLREIGNQLVDIHGQHVHQSLVKRPVQRQILDAFAGNETLLSELSALHQRLSAIERSRKALSGEAATHETQLALLRFQVAELQDLDLKPGELETLDQEHRRLSHVAELMGTCQQALAHATGDSEFSALNQVREVLRSLEGSQTYDTRLSDICELFNNAAIHLHEGTSALRRYLDSLDTDPPRLQWLEERLSRIHTLARKHRVSPNTLPQLLGDLTDETARLEHGAVQLQALTEERLQLLDAYRDRAAALTASRAAAAPALAAQITQNMRQLGMRGGQFAIIVEPDPSEVLTPFGLDRVEFTVSTNPGQPLHPIGRIASGGELSRIGLAIQTIAAESTVVPTLIFDEVDAGIGGPVAEIVGQALRALGRKRQVMCITHLPQVASLADQHLQVQKLTQARSTHATLEMLTGEARVREIARMLGGLRITERTLAHAREMLSTA